MTVKQREKDESLVNRIKDIVHNDATLSAQEVPKVTMLVSNASSPSNILQSAGAEYRKRFTQERKKKLQEERERKNKTAVENKDLRKARAERGATKK